MKPITLELINIGPYKNEKIDFEDLAEIFLITGPTGSGKSFIFDAMTFALYGTVNRASTVKTLRSTFVESEEEAGVIYTFEINRERFRVNRTVSSDHTTKTGNVTHKTGIIELFKYDNSLNEYVQISAGKKSNDINEMIQKIVGLEAEEFSKVVVLPQGEFSKFLKENSTDRTETLSKIFPVGMYSKIMEEVKEKARIKKEELDIVLASIYEIKNEYSGNNLEQDIKENNKTEKLLSESIGNLKSEIIELNKNLTLLTEEYNKVQSYEEKKQRFDELKNIENEIDKKRKLISNAEKSQRIYPLYISLE
ncbi:MAG: AAA family ATPase, partial [Treponema sp.]|nr:AAA family ATPase [Treponema sp.]